MTLHCILRGIYTARTIAEANHAFINLHRRLGNRAHLDTDMLHAALLHAALLHADGLGGGEGGIV